MRNAILLLVLALGANAARAQTGMNLLDVTSAQAAPPTETSTPVALRVLSYNLHAGQGPTPWNESDPCGITGPDGIAFLKPVADLIAKQKCDIVFLQEVMQHTRCIEGGSQSAYLARETGYHRKYAIAVTSQSNVLLSRWPIRDTRKIELDVEGAAQRRVALLARVMVPGQPEGVWVCNTHLDQQQAHIARLKQLELVKPELERLTGPVLFAGDMNAEPDSPTITAILDFKVEGRHLKDSFAVAGRGPRETSGSGDRKIDWIFSTPSLKAVDSKVLNPGLSDHRALRADFVLPRPSPTAD